MYHKTVSKYNDGARRLDAIRSALVVAFCKQFPYSTDCPSFSPPHAAHTQLTAPLSLHPMQPMAAPVCPFSAASTPSRTIPTSSPSLSRQRLLPPLLHL
ncbi:hypothetical protein GOP47_0031227 [Adiantum capillus-veneris]|nr:hypothetical protein GOP47_0031227 [Adiantum capillus-veneris]